MPASNLNELIAWLKLNPNRYLSERKTGTQFAMIPYRGSAPAVQDLLAGQIDLMISSPDKLPLVRDGSIKVFAATSDTRIAAAPGERVALKLHKFNLRRTGDPDWQTCKVDAPGSLDLCFITEGSLKPVIERLNAAGIPITAGPVPRAGALGPMTSIYCQDPDGNLIEVATYAPDPMN